jgi:hypothetical protein
MATKKRKPATNSLKIEVPPPAVEQAPRKSITIKSTNGGKVVKVIERTRGITAAQAIEWAYAQPAPDFE